MAVVNPWDQSQQHLSLLHQRYHLLHQIGTGGFGAVYQAEDMQLGKRLLAVKEMSPQHNLSAQENADGVEAFKKEALLLADLMHPSLPRIYDHFSENNRWYLVMDYIEGETLEAYLSKQTGGYLPLAQSLDIALQLCDVLGYLHTRQPPIIFRDLKPLNIMRTHSGHLYLIDFGIARHFTPGQTKDTIAFGSPGYAAPEQYGKTQTTPRSDIYSLGATLYQMLTGSDPSLTPFRFPRPRLPAGQPTPMSLVALLARMLDMDESRRPATMHVVEVELRDIAERLARGSFAPAKPPTPTSPPKPVAPPAPAPANPTPAISTPTTPPVTAPTISTPTVYGRLRCVYQGQHQAVRSIAWSPDSQLLASAGDGNVVDVWNATDATFVRRYLDHKQNIRALAWSPDGKYIASASEDKTVHVWEVKSLKTIQIYKKHFHIITALAWSPDGRYLTSSSIDKSVHVWDLQFGSTLVNYTRHNDVVYCTTWSPDGKYIASDGYNSTDTAVHIWEPLSGKRLFTYHSHAALILALGWSPDSQRLASGSADTIQVWQALTGQPLATHRGHTGQVQSLSWSPDGTRLVSCDSNRAILVWDASSGQEIFAYHGHDLQPEPQPLQPQFYYRYSAFSPTNTQPYQLRHSPTEFQRRLLVPRRTMDRLRQRRQHHPRLAGHLAASTSYLAASPRRATHFPEETVDASHPFPFWPDIARCDGGCSPWALVAARGEGDFLQRGKAHKQGTCPTEPFEISVRVLIL